MMILARFGLIGHFSIHFVVPLQMVKAGVMPPGEGLHPSSKGMRVKSAKGKITVTDGPFTETKELICGYWIWRVKSMYFESVSHNGRLDHCRRSS
jgi:hypothetical protein